MDEKHPKPRSPNLEAAPEAPEDSAAPEAPAEEALAPEEKIKKLQEGLKNLEQEKRSLFDQLIRRQADFENFRKRVAREQRENRKYAEAELLESLLPVLDAFERALAAPAAGSGDYRKGVELIYKQLWDTLARAGLQRVEAVGKTFDPFLHHAIERVESAEHPDQTVLGELQRGYLFKERLLRPALVRVGVSPGSTPPASGEAGGAEQEPRDE